MGKVKKRTNTPHFVHNPTNLSHKPSHSYAQSVRSSRVAASIQSRKSMKSNMFEELQLDTAEMEEELEESVIRQLSSHKQWLQDKKNNNDKKKKKNNNKIDKIEDSNIKNTNNFVNVLNSLNSLDDVSMEIDPSNNTNNNDNNNKNNKNTNNNNMNNNIDDGDNYDTRSVITSKSFKGLGLKKEQKKKLKKQVWLKKIALTEKHLINNKLSVIQEATPPLLKDFSSIHQSLTTVKWVNEGFRDKTRTKARSIDKKKTLKQKTNNDMAVFQKACEETSYDQNAFETAKLKLVQKIGNKKT